MRSSQNDGQDAPGDLRQHVAQYRAIGGTGILVRQWGLDGSVFGWGSGAAETAEMLDGFAEAGGTLISTADHYAGGRSEVMIGSWLRHRRSRERIVLATKVGRHPDAPGLSPASVTAAVEASLARLGTDHIDILSLDGEDPEVAPEDTLAAVDRLIHAGKVRHLGASGFSAESLRRFREVAERDGVPRVSVVLDEYSLMERTKVEQELLPVILEEDAGFLARLPLASGFLTGRYRDRATAPRSPIFDRALEYIGRRGSRVLDALEQVAEQTGESLGRVALAWVSGRPGVSVPIVRATDRAELDDLLDGRLIRLSRHHSLMLERASA